MEKIKIDRPVIVEGKYDKIKLSSILDAQIITTEGFGIFNSEEKLDYIKRIAQAKGIIVATDSDGAGLVIRNLFKSVLPPDKIINVYIPPVKGKEKRKAAPSKEGLLGLEGIDADHLRAVFRPFEATAENWVAGKAVTKQDFMRDGLCGGAESAAMRKKVMDKLELPHNMSSNALLSAINLLMDYEGYKKMISVIGVEDKIEKQ